MSKRLILADDPARMSRSVADELAAVVAPGRAAWGSLPLALLHPKGA